jgi:hypothetical protein
MREEECKPGHPVVPLSVQEFVDRTIAAEVKRIEAVFKAEIEARDKAHNIQATELSRRLDDLNHAHQNAEKDKQAFLTKSTYEAFLKGYELENKEMRSFMSNSQGRAAAYVSIVGVVFLLVQILLKFWK